MLKRLVTIVILCSVLIGISLISSEKVYACSCSSSTTEEKIERFETIFSGKVIRDDYQRGFIFDIDNIWKGELPGGYVNGGYVGMCGTTFVVGQSYLVYAYYNNNDEQYVTSMCSGNLLLSEATEDIEILNDILGTSWIHKYWILLILGIALLITPLLAWIIARYASKRRISKQ